MKFQGYATDHWVCGCYCCRSLYCAWYRKKKVVRNMEKKKKRRKRNEQTGKIYSDDYRGKEWGRGKVKRGQRVVLESKIRMYQKWLVITREACHDYATIVYKSAIRKTKIRRMKNGQINKCGGAVVGAWGRGGIGEEKRDEDKNKKKYIYNIITI